jgi:hypothetical protein
MIAEKSQTEQRAATIATALTKLESSQGMVQGYFVSESNIVDFLTGLEALGPELGSMVRTNSVSPPDTKGEQFISVSITVIGPFDAVLRTLGAIEQASYALSFSSLQLNRAGDEWGAGVTVNVGSMFSSSKVQSATTTTPTAPKKGT